MKKRRLVHVLASAALTAAMVASMGMTAFAAADSGYTSFLSGDATDGTAVGNITKTVTKPLNVVIPNVSYEFEYKFVEETSGSDLSNASWSTTVAPLYIVTSDSNNVTIDPSTDDLEDLTTKVTLDETLSIYANLDAFPQVAGSYLFEVKEVTPSTTVTGMQYIGVSYYVTVQLGYADSATSLSILGVSISTYDEDTDEYTKTTDGAVFNNSYGVSPSDDPTDPYDPYEPDPSDPDDPGTDGTINYLEITKTASGNMVNSDDTYKFTITITPGSTNNEESYYYTDSDDESGYITADQSGVYTVDVTLSNGGSVTISGLSADDTYVVTEAEADSKTKNYTTGIEITPITGTGTTLGSTTDISDTVLTTGDQSIVNDGDSAGTETVAYTNVKSTSTVPSTGIVMTFAPYILLVVFAGVFAVFFLGKKKEEF